MSKVPKFTSGKIGNFKAEHLNAISDVVNNYRAAEQVVPVRNDDVDSTDLPIFARLGAPIQSSGGVGGTASSRIRTEEGDDFDDPGDIEFNGYAWEEVVYDGMLGLWVNADSGRKYMGDLKNAAFCHGLAHDPENTPDFSGSHVMLFPSTDKFRRPILVFERPITEPVQGAIGVITGSQSPQCSVLPGGLYDVQLLELGDETVPGDIDFDPHPEGVVQAVNLVELSGGNLGGVIDSPDCDIDVLITPIPAGTYVRLHELTTYTETDAGSGTGQTKQLYSFSLANDVCVGCCGNAAGQGVTRLRDQFTDLRPPSPRSRHPIVEEMLR
jgi:hypothetical protein